MIFSVFQKKIGFWGILGPPGNHASRWIRVLWLKGVSLILAYLQTFLSFCVLDDFFLFKKNRVLGYSWSTLLWHRCYYPHRSRDALSPVCGIFIFHILWRETRALDVIIFKGTSICNSVFNILFFICFLFVLYYFDFIF